LALVCQAGLLNVAKPKQSLRYLESNPTEETGHGIGRISSSRFLDSVARRVGDLLHDGMPCLAHFSLLAVRQSRKADSLALLFIKLRFALHGLRGWS
jgi:hypothetical protein